MSVPQQQTMLAPGLHDRPAPPLAAFIALQHVLAMIGGIATAPLLIALGLGLGPADTAYLIASALFVSGAATLIQVGRIGRVGSGLLSVQGTSFTFIGPIIYAYQVSSESLSPAEALGSIFGACAVLAAAMIVVSQFVDRLRRIVTANVAGVTVLLLGITLVWTTLGNLEREASGGDRWLVYGLASAVFVTIAALSRLPIPMARLCSVVSGLALGMLAAALLGLIDTSSLATLPRFFLPEFGRYPLSVDTDVLLILAPIFLVSATESIGDLSATARLSGVRTGSADFWSRLRGGVTADSVNSLLAALVATFPNTTFSQNNGVIRLTGVASRYVGYYVAAILLLLGFSPATAGLFQIMPGAVLYGATLLMFLMVGYAGYRLIVEAGAGRRDWIIAAIAVIGGLTLGEIGPSMDVLPQSVINVISFPVSSGAFIAMLLEIALPGSKETTQ
ncbi:MAG: solute carrier family 23 protein [Pseudomonadota bacterium]